MESYWKLIFLKANKILALVAQTGIFNKCRGNDKQDAFQQQMFDPHVVVVASAGSSTTISLWVPALRADCLRGGGMVSGHDDAEEWLTPACHLTRLCSGQRLGHVYTCGHRCTSQELVHVFYAEYFSGAPCFVFLQRQREFELPLTHSHFFTLGKLEVLHTGELFSHWQSGANLSYLLDWCYSSNTSSTMKAFYYRLLDKYTAARILVFNLRALQFKKTNKKCSYDKLAGDRNLLATLSLSPVGFRQPSQARSYLSLPVCHQISLFPGISHQWH